MGAPRGAAQTYICSAEGQAIPAWVPPLWISYVDQSDPAVGVHCRPITAPGGAVARAALRLLERLKL